MDPVCVRDETGMRNCRMRMAFEAANECHPEPGAFAPFAGCCYETPCVYAGLRAPCTDRNADAERRTPPAADDHR